MTATSPYRYCKLFVRDSDRQRVLDLVASTLSATVNRYTAAVGGLLLDVRRNGDSDSARTDDFLFWPIVVEVNAESTLDDKGVVDAISKLLRTAWGANMPTVAACPFESELPWSGGIDRVS